MDRISLAKTNLEKYAIEEIPENNIDQFERLLSTNPKSKEYIDSIPELNKTFFQKYSTEKFLADLKVKEEIEAFNTSKEEEVRKFHFFSFDFIKYSLPSFVLGALLVGLFFPFILGQDKVTIETPLETAIREKGLGIIEAQTAKGKDQLFIVTQNEGNIIELSQNTKVAQGTLIQLGYLVDKGKYGLILSIDGRNKVTLHFPNKYNNESLLKAHELVYLNHAIELDDAPNFEKFYLITSTEPFVIYDIIKAAEELTKSNLSVLDYPLHLPEQFKQDSFTLLKD